MNVQIDAASGDYIIEYYGVTARIAGDVAQDATATGIDIISEIKQSVKAEAYFYLNNVLSRMATDIHARNVQAGWWTDLKTGESTLATRNRAELLKLVDSEVSEADHGYTGILNDDKLPHLPMFDVELADVAIRLFDMIGAEESLYGDKIAFDYDAQMAVALEQLQTTSHERQLLAIINRTSAAMEHLRKGRSVEHRTEMAQALVTAVAISKIRGFNLFDVIQQKVEFNASRADHKVENRMAEGGKKF